MSFGKWWSIIAGANLNRAANASGMPRPSVNAEDFAG